ncbi:hypothetical protein EB796_011566 [Bugula neritina]|uniref:Uncharacterized protein n=1 Tax=Bugula neritina TaxID=10212 RepID=A0A7J7JXQ2_BUGNE|nr:hypothetical protein EB796_011566 [Bugula neritina]
MCRSCGKKGHFAGAKFCRGAKGQINSMDNSAKKYTADTEDDIEALFTVSDNTGGEMFNINAARSAKLSVQVNNTNLYVFIDSGASSNLLDRNTAKLVGCVVKPTTKQLFAYGNKSACLDLIGETDVNVFVPSTGKCVHAKFYIFNGTATTLLCKSTSEQLGVLRVGPVSEGVHFASSDLASGDGQSWLDMFPECFEDTQSHHRIPQPQHTAPARHLNQLLASIRLVQITQVSEPTQTLGKPVKSPCKLQYELYKLMRLTTNKLIYQAIKEFNESL